MHRVVSDRGVGPKPAKKPLPPNQRLYCGSFWNPLCRGRDVLPLPVAHDNTAAGTQRRSTEMHCMMNQLRTFVFFLARICLTSIIRFESVSRRGASTRPLLTRFEGRLISELTCDGGVFDSAHDASRLWKHCGTATSPGLDSSGRRSPTLGS